MLCILYREDIGSVFHYIKRIVSERIRVDFANS